MVDTVSVGEMVRARLEPAPAEDGNWVAATIGDGATLSVLRGGRPAVLVLAAPGINCDRETVRACRVAGGEPSLVPLSRLLTGQVRLDDFAMLVLPGGFSYGDHLGAGALLAATLLYRLPGEIERFVASGRPVLGICNGFQVLGRLGLLGPVSLAPNVSGRFECRWVELCVEPSPCPFLHDFETISLPIAHGQGRVVASAEVLPRAPLRYLDNPNGSFADIAGVCNAAGNVLGLMPHPERAVHPWQCRDDRFPAGRQLFANAMAYARSL